MGLPGIGGGGAYRRRSAEPAPPTLDALSSPGRDQLVYHFSSAGKAFSDATDYLTAYCPETEDEAAVATVAQLKDFVADMGGAGQVKLKVPRDQSGKGHHPLAFSTANMALLADTDGVLKRGVSGLVASVVPATPGEVTYYTNDTLGLPTDTSAFTLYASIETDDVYNGAYPISFMEGIGENDGAPFYSFPAYGQMTCFVASQGLVANAYFNDPLVVPEGEVSSLLGYFAVPKPAGATGSNIPVLWNGVQLTDRDPGSFGTFTLLHATKFVLWGFGWAPSKLQAVSVVQGVPSVEDAAVYADFYDRIRTAA